MDIKKLVPAANRERKSVLLYAVGPVMPYVNKVVTLHAATNMLRVPGIHHHGQVEIDFRSAYLNEAGMEVWTPHEYRIVAVNLKALPKVEEMRAMAYVAFDTMLHVTFNTEPTSFRERVALWLRHLAQRIDGKTSMWATMNSDPVLKPEEYMQIMNRIPHFLRDELREAVNIEGENIAMRKAYPSLYATESKEE